MKKRGQWPRLVARVFQEEGVRGVSSMVLSPVFRRILLMVRSIDEPVPEPSTRVPVVFDLLKETEVVAYISFRPDANPSQVRSRLSRGHRCFVARHAGQIVNAGWACTSSAEIAELAREIKLAPDQVFTYDAFTSPHFRNQKIQQARLAWMARYFREAGFSRMVCHVRPENSASIRALEGAGYQPFAVMGYVKLGPWRYEFPDFHNLKHACS